MADEFGSSAEGTAFAAVLDRLDDIEERLGALEIVGATASDSATAPASAEQVSAPLPPPTVPSSVSRPSSATPRTWPQIERSGAIAAPQPTAPTATPLSSEAVLKWVGVGLVVLAAVFFVSTAIQRGWIGPKIQFAIAFAGGLGLLAASEWFRTRRPRWSLAFAHGGIVALGLVSAVGVVGLHLYSTAVAASLIAGVALASIAGASHLDRASVAGTGVVVGVLAPLIAGTPFDYAVHYSAAWLGAIIVIFTGVAIGKGWASLRLTVIGVTALLLLVTMFGIADDGDGRAALTIGGIVAAVAVISYLVGFVITPARRSPDPDDVVVNYFASIDERLIGLLPSFAWLLIAVLNDYANETALSFVAWGLAAAFGLVFFVLQQADSIDERRFYSGLVGCSVLLTIGLIGLIDGPTLLVALTLQAVGLGWLARRYDDWFLWLNAGLLALTSGLWAVGGMVDAVEFGATVGEHLAYLLVVLAVAGLAVFTHEGRSHERRGDVSDIFAVVAFMGWLLWLLAVLSDLPQGQLAVSIAWAASGAAVLLIGLLGRLGSFEARDVANIGLATLALTVMKLVTVDLSAVDTIWRAGLFFIVGLGLLRLGLLIGSLGDAEREIERAAPVPPTG